MNRAYDAVKAAPAMSSGESVDDRAMVERLASAYRARCEREPLPEGIWRSIFDTKMLPMHRALLGSELAAVAALMRRPGDGNSFYGFEVLCADMLVYLRHKPLAQGAHARWCKDHLLSVAEGMGALPFENPEAPGSQRRSPYGAMPVEEILVALDAVLGIRVDFPNPYPEEFGLETTRGVASCRAIDAIYHAWRVRDLLRGVSRPRVCEIGGGLGRTAYYAHRLGLTDYTIIDLPWVSASQAYFLMRTLGEERVVLQDEGRGDARDGVKLLGPPEFLEKDDAYDLVLNVDSMTEMPRAVAERYFARIEASASWFLSINHEGNEFRVAEVIAGSARVASKHRHRFWARPGYVEETVSSLRPVGGSR
jgi:hypothetical protein